MLMAAQAEAIFLGAGRGQQLENGSERCIGVSRLHIVKQVAGICCRLQGIVFPLAEIAGAEDVCGNLERTAVTAPPPTSSRASEADELPQCPPGAATASSATSLPRSTVNDAPPASSPASLYQGAQQLMVQLTMLLSSKNLWMRPAVLEAPAQDPQYLEVIHRVRCCWLGMVATPICQVLEGVS